VTQTASRERITFQTHPDRYRHWKLEIEDECATLRMDVAPEGGLSSGYELKLNSYDLGVDIELADAIQRLRFEHPEVRSVVLTGNLDRVFCAGANIVMLRTSAHAFKVNFCKFTNETRLAIEDASATSNKRFLAALNGTASGGGYELALACDRILLVDDRSSAVSFPEVPLLGVLPGTGGLTRITDKRKVRRDRCDVFSTLAEGVKGKRAKQWGFVDELAPLSRWDEAVAKSAAELRDEVPRRDGPGITLPALESHETERGLEWQHVRLDVDEARRVAELTISAPEAAPKNAEQARAEGGAWWPLQAFRELDEALLELRMNLRDIGLVLVRARGSAETVRATDALFADSEDWFVQEVRHLVKRVLKRMDLTSKSFYAVADEGTCFRGTFLELALASDRLYVLDDPETPVELEVSPANAGLVPMSNGISRLETRFLGTPEVVPQILAHEGPIDPPTAEELGLASFAPDAIDWEDELRLAVEERVSFSPDAMTGMESNLRFAGPETMETKIFGRLSAWQNWIFQRPNAVGERGALVCYGTPQRPEFNTERT
jgi:benzoyl-CoA-dihydrodiol lyase